MRTAFLVFLYFVVGCYDISPIAGEEIFYVVGQITGGQTGGKPLHLSIERDVPTTNTEVLDLGQPCKGFEKMADVPIPADGQYVFDVIHKDTFYTVKEPSIVPRYRLQHCFRLVAGAPDQPGELDVLFQFPYGDDALLPEVDFVPVTGHVEGDEFVFDPVERSFSEATRYPRNEVWHEVLVASGDEVIWTGRTQDGRLKLLPEILEDFEGITLQGRSVWRGFRTYRTVFEIDRSHLTFAVRNTSTKAPFPAAKVIPISRGAACTWTEKKINECPFTDGSLERFHLARESVELQLMTAIRPRLVLIRKLFRGTSKGSLFIETSTDGEGWAAIGSVVLDAPRPWARSHDALVDRAEDFAVTVSSPTEVQRLRLRFASIEQFSWSISSLAEVSVFE